MYIYMTQYFYQEKLDEIRNRRDGMLLEMILERVNIKEKSDKSYIDSTHERVINGEMSQDEEIADTFALFAAGMDTTAATLEFGITLLAKYVDIQDKVRKELLNVMKKEFDLKIVNKCPLLRAVIHEIMRIASVINSGVPHTSFKDYWIELDDGKRYKIPKNSLIQVNVEYIHIYGKKENWKRTNGDELILENWLIEDDDGGIRFVMNESFILFGVGKRDCVGRQLAVKELQYVIGYLLMNYSVSFWNDHDKNIDILTRKKYNLGLVHLDPLPLKIERI